MMHGAGLDNDITSAQWAGILIGSPGLTIGQAEILESKLCLYML